MGKIGSKNPHCKNISTVLSELCTDKSGLSMAEAVNRIKQFGFNELPIIPLAGILQIFLRQFFNPLIYILLVAAIISFILKEFADGLFISLVLIINAIIGLIQEYSAQRSAHALRQSTKTKTYVERNGEVYEIDSKEVALGDIILLTSGDKIPADVRLIESKGVLVDESLLTGESIAVKKDARSIIAIKSVIADQHNMCFAGTIITHGRAKGVVTSTGINTQLGKIASSLTRESVTKTPLLARLERFTKRIAIYLVFIILILGTIHFLHGSSFIDVLFLAVGLSVSAIPEGLPVAITVALAIATKKMAKSNVIVRKLAAVEALGSCTYIATDKTGTLTVNQLTATKIVFPCLEPFEVTGTGIEPVGQLVPLSGLDNDMLKPLTKKLSSVSFLCNEGRLVKRNNKWHAHGDKVDIALLSLAHKLGLKQQSFDDYQMIEDLPFEPENKYSAARHIKGDRQLISVKGALETVLPMCSHMQTLNGVLPIDFEKITNQAESLSKKGFRLLALAQRKTQKSQKVNLLELDNLLFIGLVVMTDPLRKDSKQSIEKAMAAGIKVAMVTGDHPLTALFIAREINLAHDESEVITGIELKQIKESAKRTEIISKAKVFARVEPDQKLEIVTALMNQGNFVAVTGDGANDAPALKKAHVGIAMGESGTDVAKQSADLIIRDDRFSSIISGIKEGRIAYSNIRKVIHLLLATGLGEIILFILSTISGLPMPLSAVQLLWLNLVTNGIQDIALAFEPGEGNELKKKPRPPKEPIFNKVMIQQITVSGLVIGIISYLVFLYLQKEGYTYLSAQNSTLLLIVLFENMLIGHCRSETKSAFAINPLKNPFLLIAAISAQLLHIGAMHTPLLADILGLHPVSIPHWFLLLAIALSVLFAGELFKLYRYAIVSNR